jgi:hypothetical protein
MGHMNQHCQHKRSTSKTPITSDMEDEEVTPTGLGSKTHLVDAVVVDQCQLYTDYWEIPGKIQQRQLVCHGVLRI